MPKKIFTDESLATLVNETKSYVDTEANKKVDKVSGKGLSTNDYTTVEKTKLANIDDEAEVNQNAFSNIKVGSTTVSADNKTDTIEFVGSNVTITPDVTNDKVTFTVADSTTNVKGIVQLTDSTSSTSTTTAATPNSVKSAYDLANTANNAAITAQETADGKANSVHTHTVSDVTDALDVLATKEYVNTKVQSNYDLWLSLGNTGTPADFLEWLRGGASGAGGVSGAIDFADMTATDTSGILGTTNASVNAQSLVNSLMERIIALEVIVGEATTILSRL